MSTKAESESWLRKFCTEHDCPPYSIVMSALAGTLENQDPEYYSSATIKSEDDMTFLGMDAHTDVPPEFWEHYENVIGKPTDYKPSYFSCSC